MKFPLKLTATSCVGIIPMMWLFTLRQPQNYNNSWQERVLFAMIFLFQQQDICYHQCVLKIFNYQGIAVKSINI